MTENYDGPRHWLSGEATMKAGTWENGKREITGWWRYNWGSDSFSILLRATDNVTGRQRTINVRGEKPEWDNWKLLATN